MTHCWRCGVDFDQTGLPSTYPCPDCQEALPGFETPFHKTQQPTKPLPLDVRAEREMAIWRLWRQGKNDQQISKELGISDQTVLRYRKRLELGPNSRGGHGTPENMQPLREGYRRYVERLHLQPDFVTLAKSDNTKESRERQEPGQRAVGRRSKVRRDANPRARAAGTRPAEG